MVEITRAEPGRFCWPELVTIDPEAAKRFYTEVFGWTAEDTPGGPSMTYTMLKLRGKEVGGLYARSERQRGMPPHWETYVAVASADEAAAKVRSLGGTVLLAPFDVMEAGRMAVLQDPTGAVLGVWQAKKSIGARLVDEPGTMCWCELATTEPKKAGAFYAGLFGWTLKPSGDGYTELVRAGVSIGGMMEIGPDGGEVPPHWLTYFSVADCDAITEAAQELGARARIPPKDIPNVGRFAVLIDPQGAQFAIVQLVTAA
jgi:predicted enzyme related to lactoylglutathione lyase